MAIRAVMDGPPSTTTGRQQPELRAARESYRSPGLRAGLVTESTEHRTRRDGRTVPVNVIRLVGVIADPEGGG